MKNGGVLLVQLEQTLSHKAMAFERIISGDFVARPLLQTLEFFRKHSRDVLVYTIGDQQPVQLSPERWVIAHQVLELVRKYTEDVRTKFPRLGEVGVSQEGSFPRIRIFGADAQRELIDRIAAHICETELSGFPIARQPKTLTEAELWGPRTRDVLFLLGGLFAAGISVFAFELKSWCVNYGLTSTREPPTTLTVPYRAKDSPTARSEYSHPDAVIVLTCLSGYYGGLSDEKLFNAFSHLLNDAYQLSKKFQQVVSINLEDRRLCTEKIFPSFRFAKGAVDYFLFHVVFPRKMRGFPYKLSASGWVIGEVKCHPLTGFSGPNAFREVLPHSVEQLSLPPQMHTNALVLGYLLQPEDSVICTPWRHKEHRSDAEGLLSLVANEWLRLTSNSDMPQAVILCDDNDELCVMDRKGPIESLQTSPFVKQLDVCYVFLAEAHTRGIDLKLPEHYRAAVTLGANLTKDRLVQNEASCIRTRRLGQGQSVVFCVPDEIHHKISTRASDNGSVEVPDVLCWAMAETWQDMKGNITLWATQGLRFLRHEPLRNEMHEALSLEQRYRPRVNQDELANFAHSDQSQAASLIATRCWEFGSMPYHSAKIDEDHEREVAAEAERERQVQRPPKARPKKHRIRGDMTNTVWHPSVRQFPGKLLVTRDYAQIVEPIDVLYFSPDVFQRLVQWILATRQGRLYPSIKESKHMALHLYAPRSNLGLKPLDKLDLYNVSGEVTNALCIPRGFIIELNLFAGQLHLTSYGEYVEPMGEDSLAATDSFILHRDKNNRTERLASTFRQSPIKFLNFLTSQIRRKSEGIDKTHMGKIFNGIILD
ncbi:hypothetical protein BDV38DRAFT_291452 [Aspergillus pseudotamarii]|uniref:ubiquitinyl hydrolase 1 n=1 Tax=Aspergillus pseudotamarii TaxID=132259 RepID=A0A5N6SZQ8_ASPPS|nr:uncharacterized protein BDV38DRAFT_291452 [Aspergillus pseudotamarii]KAE8139417.1 hypothetical protein BDV38DRAFT_291452 [Aspergillus pseudotamarii]